MQITKEHGSPQANRIRGYRPGEIHVNNEFIGHSLIVAVETLIRDWPPQSFEALAAEHMDTILELDPEVVLLGTGETQRFPDKSLLRRFLGQGIGIEVMDSASACRTFNVLMAEERRVVAALLP